jgi:copper(I)-binding protein
MPSRLPAYVGLLLCLAAAPAATIADERAGAVRILTAWARATPGPTAAVYLDLRNEGSAADRLIAAASPAAERIELHEHRSAGGVMSMATLAGLEVPPGETVQLRPGSIHLMLFGLKHPLRPGDRLPLTLTFEKGGETTVEAVTGTAGAVLPPS